MKSLYLIVDLGSFLIPFIFSFHSKIRFNRHFRTYFNANLLSAGIFLIWDAIFTSRGVWGFSDRYTLGPRIAGMPLEEILFFFCIPFACVFTYYCLSLFWKIQWSRRAEKIFFTVFSIGLLAAGIFFSGRAYTSVTFISLALFILLLVFVFKARWVGPFFTIYPILLVPFFIVNGILTGSWLESPVVWYNDAENVGMRIGTIPIEDIFYGLELILLTIFFFEVFKEVEYRNNRKIKANVLCWLALMILPGCSRHKPLATVPLVDIDRYSGKWYEIASFPQRFQKGCTCTTAEYSLSEKGYVVVVNSCRKDSVTGKLTTIKGKAFIEKGSGNAKLKVQFFWPFRGKYWIIDLANDYSYAVVGHPNREYLWILSRTPQMSDSVYHSILGRVGQMDFDTTKLQVTKQL